MTFGNSRRTTPLSLSIVQVTGAPLVPRLPGTIALGVMTDAEVPVERVGSSFSIETTIRSPGSAPSTKNGPATAPPSAVAVMMWSQVLIFWTGDAVAAVETEMDIETSATHRRNKGMLHTSRKIDAAPGGGLTRTRIGNCGPDMDTAINE